DADVCDTTHCQVYPGVGRVSRPIEQAASATAGIFALYDGRPIEALYCTDCGGRTESSENAWRGAKPLPYLRSVEDAPAPGQPPYCVIDRDHCWQIELSPARVKQLVGSVDRLRAAITAETEGGHAREIAFFQAPAAASDDEEDPGDAEPLAATPLKSFRASQW